MTYPELLIALDIGDSETVLSSIIDPYNNIEDLKYNGFYFIVCDDGDVHCFDKNGKEHKIEYIPIDCFAYDSSIVKINLEGIKSIEPNAFYNCSGLTSVTIGNSITSIGPNMFFDCNSLKSVTIGNSVKSIKEYAFCWCVELESITIGNNVTSIGGWAFSHCEGLKSATIPGNVKNIGQCAFSFCLSLRDVTLSSNIEHVGEDAFSGCANLERVLFKGKTMRQIKAMDYYPWGIDDRRIIKAGL